MFIIILQTPPTKDLLMKEKLNVKAVWLTGEGEPSEGRLRRMERGSSIFPLGKKNRVSHKHSFAFRLAVLTIMCFVRQVLNTD